MLKVVKTGRRRIYDDDDNDDDDNDDDDKYTYRADERERKFILEMIPLKFHLLFHQKMVSL